MVTLYPTFDEATAAVGDGQVVAATFKEGVPVYFLAPASADRVDMTRLSFEAVHDRQMDEYEEWLLKVAAARIGATDAA